MDEEKQEIYYIDYGAAKVYYTVTGDGRVIVGGNSVVISREKFMDYLATAKVLGHKAGQV